MQFATIETQLLSNFSCLLSYSNYNPIMRVNYKFIKPENRNAYEVILSLRDEEGKLALLPPHISIVETIASYPKKTGCFASLSWLNAQTIRASSRKTLPRHLDYLVKIGVLSKTVEMGKKVFRIQVPSEATVCSQKEYRTAKNLPEYAYRTVCKENKMHGNIDGDQSLTEWVYSSDASENLGSKLATKQNPNETLFFNNNLGINLAHERANLIQSDRLSLPTFDRATLEEHNIKNTIFIPPKTPLCTLESEKNLETFDSLVRPATQSEGGETTRPLPDGASRRESPQDIQEDFVVIPKGRKPKNQLERQAAAKQKLDHGHIANPLGGPDNRPHRCNPKLARDISLDRSVTVSQLYRHACKLYEKAFGPGVFEGMMPSDRTAIGSMFGELKQRFIDYCEGLDPSNRDLSEYFEWFMEPQRLQKMLSVSKYTLGDKPVVHFRQILGAAYIRRFYDEVLKKKIPEQKRSNDILSETGDFWDSAFRQMREINGSNWNFCRILASFGYPAMAQFLFEEYGFDDLKCKQKLLSEIEHFINSAENKNEAVLYLALACKSSEQHEKYLDEKCVWHSWKEKVSDIIPSVCKKLGLANV